MKRLILKKMYLLSTPEKRGRVIEFHRRATIIKGGNDTGKSSIIKSIYATFGADPEILHYRWKDAIVISLIKFSVDDNEYSILRAGKSYSLFDSESKILGTYVGVTNGIGPVLAGLLNFGLLLTSREGLTVVPPPKYIFAPFYLDQDKGWTTTWAGFSGLKQFSHWRKNVVEYHTGLYPNEFYKLKSEVEAIKQALKDPKMQQSSLIKLKKSHEERLSIAGFDINIRDFQEEVNRLLTLCQEIKSAEEMYKSQMIELRNHESSLNKQLSVVSAAKAELDKDYNYLIHQLDDHIECPICGSEYENSFAARFGLAADVDDCTTIILEIRDELEFVRLKIGKVMSEINDARVSLREVESLLLNRKEEVTLQQLIENEGKKQMGALIIDELNNIQEIISRMELQQSQAEVQMKRFQDKERKRRIAGIYREYMRRYLRRLNVHNMKREAYKEMHCKISEMGSDLIRAQLAYFMSIIEVISIEGSGVFCPIVIDSPQQQDQDVDNYSAMLEFINDRLPENSQLILALVDDSDVEFGGTIIELNEENYALSQEEYPETVGVMRYYIDAHMQQSDA